MSNNENDPLWLTPELIKGVLTSYLRRVELIRLAGGIALKDVVDGTATIPPGWAMDIETCYFVPPGFDPSDRLH